MKRVAAPLLATALLAGCGHGAQSTAITDPHTRQKIVADVDAVRVAAAVRDRFAAEAALAALTRDVAAGQAQGLVETTRAQTILAAADRVAEDVRTIPLPTPSTVTVTPPPPPPPPPSPENQHDNNEHNSELAKKIQKLRREAAKRQRDAHNGDN